MPHKPFHRRLWDRGITADDLDEMVHDTASDMASNINNGGVESQVAYLLECGWTETDILEGLGLVRSRRCEE